MKLPRRTFLHLAAGAAALPAVSRFASAQAYPTRPVRLLVGFPAGGNADTIARPMGQWLAEHFGQPFVIENRPGAGSSIAAEAVARAPPDGHTLLMASSANAINATLYDKLSYNFLRDLAPVAGVCHAPLVMVVHPSFPAKTVPEFIAYAKANPSKINMASVGNGTTPHVVGELFKMMTSLDLVHVPYRGGGAALTDLLGGQVQVFFPGVSGYIEHIRTGKLRALAVTSATRMEALPNVPTIGDFVPGFEANYWYGLTAPKNTPAEVVHKLNREVNAGIADPKMRVLFADLGYTVFASSPAEFGKFITDETEKWAKVVKFSGAKAD